MSPSQLWLDLFKAALSSGSSPKDAEIVALKAEEIVLTRRGLDAPIEKLLRAVDGIGLYSDYPPDLKARLYAVFEAASAVKAARAS